MLYCFPLGFQIISHVIHFVLLIGRASLLSEEGRWAVEEGGTGRGSREPEGATRQPDLLQLHENNSRFEKGFGEIYWFFGGVGVRGCDFAEQDLLSLSFLMLRSSVPRSPTTFEELNLRENAV